MHQHSSRANVLSPILQGRLWSQNPISSGTHFCSWNFPLNPTQPNTIQCIIVSWPATLGCYLGDTRQKALLAVVCGAARKWWENGWSDCTLSLVLGTFAWMNEIIFMFVEIQQDGSNKFVRRVNKIKRVLSRFHYIDLHYIYICLYRRLSSDISL